MFGIPVFGFYDNSPVNLNKINKISAVKGVSNSTVNRNVVSRDGRSEFGYVEKRGPARVDTYYSNMRVTDRSQMIENEQIIVFAEDNVDFFPDPILGLGSKITIKRATELTLNDKGKLVTYRTWGKTVEDFLAEKEISLTKFDLVMPVITTPTYEGMMVEIIRADNNIEIEKQYLQFETEIINDPWLPDGKVRIKQGGELGERQIHWRVVKLAGGELKRELIEDKIVSQPQKKIVLRGSKPVSLSGPYKDWINEAAAKYGANAEQMYRVMMCESGGDPYALSPSGRYKGLFQYDNRTWSASGWGNEDIFNPHAQINAAAKAWASRYTKWPVTSRICGDMGR